MNINLILLTPEYMPEVEGKYLVRTVTSFGNVHFFDAAVTKHYNKEKDIWTYSIDVNHQIVTHISAKPVIEKI